VTFFDDLVLNPPPERADDAPGFADTLAQVKAAWAQRRAEGAGDMLADLLAARDAILDAPYRPDPPPILTRRSAELYNELRAAPRDGP
jgi:hypothetical protein